MASFNKVILMGGLTRDPELRSVGDTHVCSMSIAVSEKYKDREITCYIDIEAWGKTAENCAKYLAKGRQVLVDGRIKFDTWEKDGQKRSKHSVRADSVTFLHDGRANSQDSATAKKPAAEDTDLDNFDDLSF